MKYFYSRPLWPSLTICLLGVLVGCIPKMTLYADYRVAQPAPAANVTRIFLDRDGSIYPDASVPINEAALNAKRSIVLDPTHCPTLAAGYLLNYFRYYPEGRAAYAQLLTRYGVAAQANGTAEWAALQYAMQREVGQNLNARLRQRAAGGPRPTLVVLIHGFNVPAPADGTEYEPFQEAEKKISTRYLAGQPVEYLEVFWDGLHQGLPLGIWTYAQANAPLAGLTLRGVLGAIDPSYPIRILTHSLGATVAANALWNVRQAKGRRGDCLSRWFTPKTQVLPAGDSLMFGQMRTDTVHYRTPRHPNLRLATVAPAQPGLTYADFYDRTPALAPTESAWCDRVIIGYNRHDYATNKIFRPLAKARFGLGSTSLAVYSREYGRYVWPIGQVAGRTARPTTYWVSLYPKRITWSCHSMVKYLNKPNAQVLLTLLFDAAPAPSTPPRGR